MEKCDELLFVDPAEAFYDILLRGSDVAPDRVRPCSVAAAHVGSCRPCRGAAGTSVSWCVNLFQGAPTVPCIPSSKVPWDDHEVR